MKPKQKAAIQRKKISAKALTHKESDAAAQIDGPGISGSSRWGSNETEAESSNSTEEYLSKSIDTQREVMPQHQIDGPGISGSLWDI
ncbi:hypothetical protein CEXT_346061 [Caerostris extrusa]|uniref:Uncharacterized protein n=1 Tax=Caerostris extrusa TaxID=172846 RepID=A0AAV4T3G1_CAEEX|nr:hypothetical protein CEXT_346061 [Caerostris extrusa]